jgi:transcriptional regulator with XRE-family HTH domain
MRKIDDFYAALGARIRELRDDRKYTQQELADLVGLKRTSITNVERGTQRLMADQLLAIARALHTTVEDLLLDITAQGAVEKPPVDSKEMPTVARFVEKVLADTDA